MLEPAYSSVGVNGAPARRRHPRSPRAGQHNDRRSVRPGTGVADTAADQPSTDVRHPRGVPPDRPRRAPPVTSLSPCTATPTGTRRHARRAPAIQDRTSQSGSPRQRRVPPVPRFRQRRIPHRCRTAHPRGLLHHRTGPAGGSRLTIRTPLRRPRRYHCADIVNHNRGQRIRVPGSNSAIEPPPRPCARTIPRPSDQDRSDKDLSDRPDLPASSGITEPGIP